MNISNTAKSANYLLGLALLAITGCSKSSGSANDNGNGATNGKFFIAAALSSSSGSGGTGEGTTYLLSVDSVNAGETTIVNNGIVQANTFTHWADNGNNVAFGFLYGQGNDYLASGFEISSLGKLQRSGDDIMIPGGFATVGSAGNYVIAGSKTGTLSNGNTGVTFNFIDFTKNNLLTQKSIETANFQGTGLEAAFVGAADAGNGEFFSGVMLTNGDQDKVYVVKFDTALNVKQFYQDNRLSYAAGQMKSARYSQIDNADNGDTYVFSGSYSATTTKPAGALLIKKGTSAFDASYYFNIEEKSGGFRFRKVFHLTEDYFLLEMYNATGAPGSSSPATQYAIVQMSAKDFKWVTGVPAMDQISSAGWPYAHDGKAYIGIATANDDAAVYIVDAKTAVAKKGMVVKGGATSIPRVAYLVPQQ